MRTTLTLDEDVVRKLQAEVRRTGRSFRAVVNEVLRAGLNRRPAPKAPPFKIRTFSLGLRPGLNLDSVEELLDLVEGPDRR